MDGDNEVVGKVREGECTDALWHCGGKNEVGAHVQHGEESASVELVECGARAM